MLLGQSQVVEFLDYGLTNGQVFSEVFLKSYGKQLGETMNGGWFVTAKVLRPGKVELGVHVNYVTVASADRLYNVEQMISNGELTDVTLADGSVVKAPTVANQFFQNQERPRLDYGEEIRQLPNGSNFGYLVTPTFNVSVGLPLNTELALRYQLPYEDKNIGVATLYGVALKHSIKNYLPFIRRTPFLQVALMGNYALYENKLGVSYRGQNGQELVTEASAYGGKMLIGMDFPVIGFNAGVGYSTYEAAFKFSGSFESIPGETTAVQSPELFRMNDARMVYELSAFMRLLQFRIGASYSISSYSMISGQLVYEFGN
jgi:hypothetical protein